MSDPWEDYDAFDDFEDVDDKDALLQQLQIIDNKLIEINEQEAEEILDVKQALDVSRGPLWARRAALVEKLPAFWPTVLMNHAVIAEILRADEADCLQSLTAIEVRTVRTDAAVGFSIFFYFFCEANPYFENCVLTKTFYERWNESATANANYGTFSTNTPIMWKEGRDILMQADKDTSDEERQNGKYNSIFEWFVDDSEGVLKHEVTEAIRTDIWTNPMQYFLAPLDDEDPDEEDFEDNMSR